MNRRDFIRLSAAASVAVLRRPLSFAEIVPNPSIRLTLRTDRLGNKIDDDFTGLSYESAQLGNPNFFSGDNTDLAGFMRRLGRSGVLRIGGNTSEYCYWTPNSEKQASAPNVQSRRRADKANPMGFGLAVGPDTGHKAPAPVNITSLAIRNLRAFLDACGWKLIYGLNMGTGTAEDAAHEAAYVMDVAGSKLIAFQLCNEPDLFFGMVSASRTMISGNLPASGSATTRRSGDVSPMHRLPDRIQRTTTSGSYPSRNNSNVRRHSFRNTTMRRVHRRILR